MKRGSPGFGGAPPPSAPELEGLRSRAAAGLMSLGRLRGEVDAATEALEATIADVDGALRRLATPSRVEGGATEDSTRGEPPPTGVSVSSPIAIGGVRPGDDPPSNEEDPSSFFTPREFPVAAAAPGEGGGARELREPWMRGAAPSYPTCGAGDDGAIPPPWSPDWIVKAWGEQGEDYANCSGYPPENHAPRIRGEIALANVQQEQWGLQRREQNVTEADAWEAEEKDENYATCSANHALGLKEEIALANVRQEEWERLRREREAGTVGARSAGDGAGEDAAEDPRASPLSAAAEPFRPKPAAAGVSSPLSVAAMPFRPGRPEASAASAGGLRLPSFAADAPSFRPNGPVVAAASDGRRSPSFSVEARSFRPSNPSASSGLQPPSSSVEAQPFQPNNPVASSGRPSLSFRADAQPFHSKTMLGTVQPLRPNASSTTKVSDHSPNENGGATSNRKTKAVVVEISASKHAAAKKAPQPTALPGMEYLVGIDDARAEAKERAQSERGRRAEKEEEGTAAGKHGGRAVAAARERDEAGASAPKETPPAAAAPEEDEMPELDDIMALLENRAMSKEERQKQLDKMFG